ncbi:hypothetical protein JZ00_15890 [Pseudomonas frederiksbergensis]|uniref:Uncharacterized protein n=1 Tax=Pseudomonas frederiksbergensis TaxID=104087 RepID=A0A0B1Z3C6_9PSED|nr:hypothetical protein JZ00_15890 [Pseudomonas frederiksbergensis]
MLNHNYLLVQTSSLPDLVLVEVPKIEHAELNDQIEFFVRINDRDQLVNRIVITADTTFPLVCPIPKEVFSEDIKFITAELYYLHIRSQDGNMDRSPMLTLLLI